MERWLLISNCQTFGVANSLTLASPALDVTAVDIWTYKAEAQRYNVDMPGYDRVVIHPDVARLSEFDAARATCVNHLPSLEFDAYHPDSGYFEVDGETVSGPMMAYQFLLAMAAHEEGLSPTDTRALFTKRVYEARGYMNGWSEQRDAVVRVFRDHGIDVAAPVKRWGRERAFMYSVNHPRIEALYDIATMFLKALGRETHETGVRPADNLALGPCVPVYPEIGEALGVRGSYVFKQAGTYRTLDLDRFLAGSVDALARYPRGAIRPLPQYRRCYDHIRAVVRGEA